MKLKNKWRVSRVVNSGVVDIGYGLEATYPLDQVAAKQLARELDLVISDLVGRNEIDRGLKYVALSSGLWDETKILLRLAGNAYTISASGVSQLAVENTHTLSASEARRLAVDIRGALRAIRADLQGHKAKSIS